MQRSHVLLFALAGAVGLLVLSRTKRGELAAVDALEEVIVSVKRVAEVVADVSLPRGIRNNNPGNIRWLPAERAWRGQVADDGDGYGVYESMALGVRALGKQLLAYERRGLRTVREIISTWAPVNENPTDSYIKAVSRALNVPADDRIDVEILLGDLARAIIKHENGGFFTLAVGDIDKWVRLP